MNSVSVSVRGWRLGVKSKNIGRSRVDKVICALYTDV